MPNLTHKSKNISELDIIVSQIRHLDIRQFMCSDLFKLFFLISKKNRKLLWARECKERAHGAHNFQAMCKLPGHTWP